MRTSPIGQRTSKQRYCYSVRFSNDFSINRVLRYMVRLHARHAGFTVESPRIGVWCVRHGMHFPVWPHHTILSQKKSRYFRKFLQNFRPEAAFSFLPFAHSKTHTFRDIDGQQKSRGKPCLSVYPVSGSIRKTAPELSPRGAGKGGSGDCRTHPQAKPGESPPSGGFCAKRRRAKNEKRRMGRKNAIFRPMRRYSGFIPPIRGRAATPRNSAVSHRRRRRSRCRGRISSPPA